MDLKGITWAADIYEKFEAMCLEAEEAIYKDTIKYVENQVQKVGVGVTTFYTEVVQDLLPPSCVEINNKQAGVEDFCDLTAQDSTLSVHDDAIHHPLAPPKVSAEPLMQEKNNSKGFSGESLRHNNDATDCNLSYYDLPPVPIDESRNDGSLSQINPNTTDTREVDAVGEEATTSYEDNFDIEVIEADSILEPFEKSRLEESCILVEGDDEIDYVSQESKKFKSSYKKKIYNVLSLNLKSPRKQDVFVNQRKLSAANSCDFGWELL